MQARKTGKNLLPAPPSKHLPCNSSLSSPVPLPAFSFRGHLFHPSHTKTSFSAFEHLKRSTLTDVRHVECATPFPLLHFWKKSFTLTGMRPSKEVSKAFESERQEIPKCVRVVTFECSGGPEGAVRKRYKK